MKSFKIMLAVLLSLSLGIVNSRAQQVLNLDDCRTKAIENNKSLKMSRAKIKMAQSDREIARSYYFPDVSATATYMHNQKNLSLINDEMSDQLRNAGVGVQQIIGQKTLEFSKLIESNPALMAEIAQSPMWQTLLGAMKQKDISQAINALGRQIDDAFHVDIHNVFAGAVTVTQPLYMGGKIVASNRIAAMAEELSKQGYDLQYQDVLVGVDQAYWQVVSIANKKKLADNFCELLHKMSRDVEISVKEGVATESDALQIKVKTNEAEMLATKASNGLVLAKMFLCKQIGLPLNSQISLADETLDAIPEPQLVPQKDMDEIYENRPEVMSLYLASRIYDKKVTVQRSEMLPKIALAGNYLISNPNSYNGFQKKWGGMFNVGVVVNVPIFHGFNARSKTNKAKAESVYYRLKLDNVKEMVELQVTQLRQQRQEYLEKLRMAKSNLASAEENLRTAKVGFEAGVITTNTMLAAHTAWLGAHSDFIDAGIELQINNVNMNKAEGNYRSDRQLTSDN